jgi:hypothetical protein
MNCSVHTCDLKLALRRSGACGLVQHFVTHRKSVGVLAATCDPFIRMRLHGTVYYCPLVCSEGDEM